MEPISQLRMGLWGRVKTGKTTVALTWPKPLVHFDMDLGFERAEPNFAHLKILKVPFGQPLSAHLPGAHANGIDIITVKYMPPIKWGTRPQGYIEWFNRVATDIMAAFEADWIKSIVYDTGSMLNKNRTSAQLELVQQRDSSRVNLIQIEYGPRNDDMRNMHAAGASYGKNFVVVCHQEPVYEQKLTSRGIESIQVPGQFTWDGFGELDRYVDIVLRTDKLIPDNGKIACEGTILTNGYALESEGQKVSPATFDTILAVTNYYRSLQNVNTTTNP